MLKPANGPTVPTGSSGSAGSNRSAGLARHAHYLLLAALLLAGVTYWMPWVDHDASALKLSGQDMGEFVKFLPPPGPRPPRTLFYVPPFVCSVCLTLLVTQPDYPRWLCAVALCCALLMLSGLLPPVWGHPRELFAGEFRLQGYGLAFGTLLVVGHGLFRAMALRLRAFIVGVLSLIGLIAGQGSFWLVRPHIWNAYNTPTVSLGWGLWLHIAAWGGAIALVATICVRATRQRILMRRNGDGRTM